jgi:hypothetical protein
VLPRFAARLIALAFIGPVGLEHGGVSQGLQYQADIQIKTLEITKSRTNLSLRVVIYSENNDGGSDPSRRTIARPPKVKSCSMSTLIMRLDAEGVKQNRLSRGAPTPLSTDRAARCDGGP